MAIGADLRTLLIAESTITDELASTTAFYTDKTDQNASMPYLVLTQLSEDPLKALDGTSGMRMAEFDLDCVASARATADTVAGVVEAYFNDFTGTAGSSTVNAVLLNDRAYDVIPIGQGTENYKFVTTLNFQVQYT